MARFRMYSLCQVRSSLSCLRCEPMADIFEDMGTIMALAEAHDSGQLFNFGRERGLALAGESVTESLVALDMADYVASLATVARLASPKLRKQGRRQSISSTTLTTDGAATFSYAVLT